jgi:hypothetical protein
MRMCNGTYTLWIFLEIIMPSLNLIDLSADHGLMSHLVTGKCSE